MISTLGTKDLKKRVGLSWFDVPEKIQTEDAGESVMLSEGLLLFTHLTKETERETSI